MPFALRRVGAPVKNARNDGPEVLRPAAGYAGAKIAFGRIPELEDFR